MKVMQEIFTKKFKNTTFKQAYLDSCRWIAEHIMSDPELLSDASWQMTKLNEKDSPTVELKVYTSFDEETLRESTCDKCREFHKSFYINQDWDCGSCKMTAYYKNLDVKINTKSTYRKERLRLALKKD